MANDVKITDSVQDKLWKVILPLIVGAVSAIACALFRARTSLDLWFYLCISAALLALLSLLYLLIRRWVLNKIKLEKRDLETRFQEQDMQLDLIKGVLYVYVMQLSRTLYDDSKMVLRSKADDLPIDLKELMKKKWYNDKTEAEIDQFISNFLSQIGYNS